VIKAAELTIPPLRAHAGYMDAIIDAYSRSEVLLTPNGFPAKRVNWGAPWLYQCAAYWVSRATELHASNSSMDRPHRLGSTLVEEVAACLLGGYGITYEMNVAAFHAIRDSGLIADDNPSDRDALAFVLSQPLDVLGRVARYRFPNQKAERLASALVRLRNEQSPADPYAAREWLLTFQGVGPKTASWIVRNQWVHAHVAIIDVHIRRAGVRAGIFDREWTVARDYWQMEAVFLEWANYGNVPPAELDAVIWMEEATRARRRIRRNGSQLV
jgi:hypothetical protein